MKQYITYSIIALFGISVVSCKGKKDRTQEIADNLINLSVEKVINPTISYGTVYDIDSNEYKTVKIGKYEWFAQNLRTTSLSDGTPIANVTDNNEWNKAAEPAYSSYNNAEVSAVNGLLYNYKTVQSNKACPEGWEVANDSAWTNLAEQLKGFDNAGIALKSDNVWNEEQKATNASGFSAVPSGFRERKGTFHVMGENAIWWSANDHNENNAMYKFIDKNVSLNQSHIYRNVGLSIRCVRSIQ